MSFIAMPMTPPPASRAPPLRGIRAGEGKIAHFIFEYLKLGESLAKIGIVTLSLIDQTIS